MYHKNYLDLEQERVYAFCLLRTTFERAVEMEKDKHVV